jgi:hypothetical protein
VLVAELVERKAQQALEVAVHLLVEAVAVAMDFGLMLEELVELGTLQFATQILLMPPRQQLAHQQ